MRRTRRTFTAEEKLKVVMVVIQDGITVSDVAKEKKHSSEHDSELGIMRNNGGNKHRASGCKSKGKIPGSSRKNHPPQWKKVFYNTTPFLIRSSLAESTLSVP